MTTRMKNVLVAVSLLAVAAVVWWCVITVLRPAVMPPIPTYRIEMWAGGYDDDIASDHVSSKPDGFLKVHLRPMNEVLGPLEVKPFITQSNGEVKPWAVWFDRTPANVLHFQARIAELPTINTPGEYQLTVIIGRVGLAPASLAEAKKQGNSNDWTLVEGRITVLDPSVPDPPHVHQH